MTEITTTWVHPLPNTNPNIPPGSRSFPVHPISNMPVATIPSVLVFPGRIDPVRLITAIKRLSQNWPNLFGRYEEAEHPNPVHGGHYIIRSTQSPIRLETQDLSLNTDQITPFPNNEIIQPSTSIYTPALPPDYYLPDSSSPLFAVRLTTVLPCNTSVLGITISHILADAASANKVLHDLSNAYQDLPLSTPPTFAPHINVQYREPSEDLLKEFDMCVCTPKTLREVGEEYGEYAEGTERSVVRLSRDEVGVMVGALGVEGILSTMDVISGWWVDLMERLAGKIESLLYTINYRNFFPDHPDFPSNLPTLSANVVQMRSMPITPLADGEADRAQEIARTIRAGINELREDPEKVKEWLSVIAWRYETAVRDGKTFVFVPPEGQVVINSNLRYNWVATFGFPFDQCSFHTSFSGSRFLRVFEANPTPGQSIGQTDIELVFNIPKDAVSTLSTLVAVDRNKWSNDNNASNL